MLSRALSLATVMLLIGCFAAGSAFAQATNLEAGKSPSQIFAGTCTACHKSPRGLLKTVPTSSLPGFLRQHYTTSSDMASVLSSFLVSNGAADTRYQPKDQQKQQAKQEAKPEAKPDQLDRFGRRQHPPAPAQEALTPDAEGRPPQPPGRDAKRLARPGQATDAATDEKSGAKQKLGRRGKPGAEEPKTDEAAKAEPAKEDVSKETAKETVKEPPKETPKETPNETSKDVTKRETDKVDSGKGEGDKPEAAKPAGEGKSETVKETAKETVKETAKVDAAKEPAGSEQTPLRPDPVPSVTPAPPAPTSPAGGTSESTSSLSAAAPPPSPTPPAAPAGPPAPPISQ